MIKFLILLFISGQVLALDINDTMSMKVYDILKGNRVSINRGYSDGLYKNDHVRVNSSTGYHARGIVIFVKENFSILQLYRVIDDDSISRDVNYIMTSTKLSQIAPHMRRFLKTSFKSQYNSFQPRSSMEAISINNDLPKKTSVKSVKKAIE